MKVPLPGSPNIIMSWLIFVDGDDGPEHCFNPQLMMFVLIAGADISRSASVRSLFCGPGRLSVDMGLLASRVGKAVAG